MLRTEKCNCMTHDGALELLKLLNEIKKVTKPNTANIMAMVRVKKALKQLESGFEEHKDRFKSKLAEVINDTKKNAINTRNKQKNVCRYTWEVGAKQAPSKKRKKNGAKV